VKDPERVSEIEEGKVVGLGKARVVRDLGPRIARGSFR